MKNNEHLTINKISNGYTIYNSEKGEYIFIEKNDDVIKHIKNIMEQK